ncbi:MAG: transposase family protein [Actinomycetota bacterium]
MVYGFSSRTMLVRNLSILGKGVYLHLPGRQFDCSTCKRYPTEP